MDKMRAWGFALGVMIAWFIGFAVATARLGEANRRPSILSPYSGSDSPRGDPVR
jgi:hypothetical protein